MNDQARGVTEEEWTSKKIKETSLWSVRYKLIDSTITFMSQTNPLLSKKISENTKYIMNYHTIKDMDDETSR